MKKCGECARTVTPLWRPGPLGSKTLCNACGLRFFRRMHPRSSAAERRACVGAAPRPAVAPSAAPPPPSAASPPSAATAPGAPNMTASPFMELFSAAGHASAPAPKPYLAAPPSAVSVLVSTKPPFATFVQRAFSPAGEALAAPPWSAMSAPPAPALLDAPGTAPGAASSGVFISTQLSVYARESAGAFPPAGVTLGRVSRLGALNAHDVQFSSANVSGKGALFNLGEEPETFVVHNNSTSHYLRIFTATGGGEATGGRWIPPLQWRTLRPGDVLDPKSWARDADVFLTRPLCPLSVMVV